MSKKNNRRALFCSVISLLLCVSMLLGTTLAWFTDTVSSTGNIIKTGKLDVAMEYTSDLAGEWKDASEATIFSGNLWEPGYSDMKFIRVSNTGNLAFQYQMHVLPAVKAADGEVDLADVIDVYIGEVGEGFTVPSAFATDMAGMSKLGTLAELMEGTPATGVLLPTKGAAGVLPDGVTADTGAVTYCVVLHMQEDAGNEYQNLTVGNNFTIQLVATQMGYEQDAFGSSYDADADYTALKRPNAIINEEVVAAVTVNEEQKLAEEVTLEGDAVSAEVPAGVKLAEGVEALTLSVETIKEGESEANISLSRSEVATSLDVHMEGVAEDNTVPMLITLEGLFAANLNQGNYTMYHVENGETVAMTCVDTLDELDAHNEFYYDAATGNVVMCVASFSEYVAVTDNKNLWQGGFKYDWYVGKSSPYTISTADQLAGFGAIVDGTAEGIAADTFEGKIVYLDKDIDLAGGYSLNPIGCGYDPATGVKNSNDVVGRPFKGTFDGQNHTISNLYQNGWDLGLSYCNLGGGLFGSVANGTVQNLTITGADIKMECVEQGVLVGLSQGACTYKNIYIYDSKVANYQKATGGLIGEVSPVDKTKEEITKIENVTIGANVVVGSLWGDFDAPVGGVIGARWDDGNKTKIEMINVKVSCCLDVYNDVTSSYQWYAYRRAGMLIGNTETAETDANGRTVATAKFLECTNVVVNYGSWTDYHYCEFSEEYNSPSWPWVRVEAGENCSAFSNPRWGVAKESENGPAITSIIHEHHNDDDHNVELVFNQLYGGGQGVYGQPEHDGVTIDSYDYSVTYMNRGKVFAVDYVKNDSAYSIKHTTYVPTRTDSTFKQWVNAGGTRAADIEVGNTTDYIVYDSWHSVYTARFLNQQGDVIYEEEFNTSQSKLNNVPDVPSVEGLITVGWEEYNLQTATGDIAIRPIYKINDYVQLNPIDSDNDGTTNYYQVVGSNIPANNTDIIIPEIVNGIEVQEIITGAFANGGLRDVHVPHSVKTIGKNAFCKDSRTEYPQIQIIFDGTQADWDGLTKTSGWDDNIGQGSVIICTRNNPIGYYKQEGSNGILGIGTKVKWVWHEGTPDWYPRA